jgi:hypothetical protein
MAVSLRRFTSLPLCLALLLLAAGCGSSSVDGWACQSPCELGATACQDGGLVTCGDADGDGCPEWGAPLSCPAGQVCQAGACLPEGACADECAAGATECVGPKSFRTCGQFDADSCLEWGAAVACAAGADCVNGSCPAACVDECQEGETGCDGAALLTCVSDDDDDPCTEWASSACPAGQSCASGVCAASCVDSCPVAGQVACDGTTATHTCGDFDGDGCREWGARQECAAGLVCERSQCRPPACNDECAAVGTRECIGAGFRECGSFDADACLEWSDVQPCPAGEGCSAGVCSDVCSDDCASTGDTTCEGTIGFRTCGAYDGDECLDWSSVVLCPAGEACAGGACVRTCVDECASGAVECADAERLRRCGNFDADVCREWGPPEACPEFYGCDAGAARCVLACADECEGGAAECSGPAARRVCGDFDADPCREWGPAADCPQGQACVAASGQCSPPACTNECETGARRCSDDGLGVVLCGNSDDDVCLEWGAAVGCGPGSTCQSGVCTLACSDECTADARICASDTAYRVCGNFDNDACLEFGQPLNCQAFERCEAGACVRTCRDECSTPTALACNVDGTASVSCGDWDDDPCLEWGNAQPCQEGLTCSNGRCGAACENECQLGERVCSGDGYTTCGQYDQDNCWDWSPVVLCAAFEACAGGVCVLTCQDECEAGAGRCVDDASYQTCGNFDEDPCREYSAATTACAPGTFCHRTECIGLTPPAVVRLNELLFDGPSTDPDDVFIELRGPGGLSLDHFGLENVNGADGDVVKSVDLLGQRIPADGYFVVVHPEALGTPGNPALAAVADFSSTAADFQNGPDSVRLLWGGRTTVDALGYGFTAASAELPNFAGETESVGASRPGESLTRDEASVDSDVNRWDFRVTDAPTPGAPYVPTWTKRAVTGPDAANPGLAYIDLAADAAGGLRAAFVRNELDAVQAAAWTGAGAWQVETVVDEFLHVPADEAHFLYWVSPPAVDPAGRAAVATLGSVYVTSDDFPELDGFRGVRLGYSEKVGAAWTEELLVELPEEDFLGIPGRWIWSALGLRHARLADGAPVVACVVVDQVAGATAIFDLARVDGVWTERVAVDALDVIADFDLVTDRAGGLHLFSIAGLPETGFELQHRSAGATGAWSAPDVVVSGLVSPGSLRAAADPASAAVTVCVLDYARLDVTPAGDLAGGASVVRCARSGDAGAWAVEVAVPEQGGFFPIDFAVAADGPGVALIVTEFYQRAVWSLTKAAQGSWQREYVDFGGETGFWPALLVSGGRRHALFGAVTPLRGVVHAQK